MVFVIVGICLFLGFVFLFLLLTPRPSAAGALLQEVTRPMRQVDVPAWRSAMDVDILARPFTLIRGLFSPEPDPKLVRRLMLAGYRKPAHADIFLGCRLAVPAILGLLIALFVSNNAIMYFIIATQDYCLEEFLRSSGSGKCALLCRHADPDRPIWYCDF